MNTDLLALSIINNDYINYIGKFRSPVKLLLIRLNRLAEIFRRLA